MVKSSSVKEELEVVVTRSVLVHCEDLRFDQINAAAEAAGVPIKEADVEYADLPYFIRFEWEDTVGIEAEFYTQPLVYR